VVTSLIADPIEGMQLRVASSGNDSAAPTRGQP
jgi:hypothetical protein